MFNRREMLLKNCPSCGLTPDYKLIKMINSRGIDIYRYYCAHCNALTKLFEKRKAVPESIKNSEPLIINKIDLKPIKKSNNKLKGVCERCGEYAEIETHHWAPKKLFSDFNKWPTSELCRPCHEEWHRIVTGDLVRKIKA